MGICATPGKFSGLFHDVTGELSYDPARPTDTRVDLLVNTASVDMNNSEHNELLRSGEFFDAVPVRRTAGAAEYDDRRLGARVHT